MTDQDNLRNRIARVIHDVNERLRSDNGLRYSPLEYDQLPDRHRENRESIAQAIIDELGLTVEEGHITGKWEDVYRTPVPDCPSNRRHNQ